MSSSSDFTNAKAYFKVKELYEKYDRNAVLDYIRNNGEMIFFHSNYDYLERNIDLCLCVLSIIRNYSYHQFIDNFQYYKNCNVHISPQLIDFSGSGYQKISPRNWMSSSSSSLKRKKRYNPLSSHHKNREKNYEKRKEENSVKNELYHEDRYLATRQNDQHADENKRIETVVTAEPKKQSIEKDLSILDIINEE